MSSEHRALAERAITKHVQALPAFRHARRIGIYLAFDGEPSLADLMRAAARSGKRLFAPVVRKRNMCFKEEDEQAR